MKGSCLCGGIAYEVDALAGPIVHCHCRTCRKAHSAVFNTAARVDRDKFRWLKGEGQLTAFESSPGKLRWFCRECGSQLMAEWIDKPEVVLRVASLDDDPGVEVKAHIWTEHDVPWLNYSDDLPKFEQKPR